MTRILAATLALVAGPALAHGDHAPAAGPEHGLLHLLPGLSQPAALLLVVAIMAAIGLGFFLRARRSDRK